MNLMIRGSVSGLYFCPDERFMHVAMQQDAQEYLTYNGHLVYLLALAGF